MNKTDDMKSWRRAIHSNPETAFEEFETADFIAEKLQSFGVDEVHRGIGQTGIVAVINGKTEANQAIALRADMDALHIHEEILSITNQRMLEKCTLVVTMDIQPCSWVLHKSL